MAKRSEDSVATRLGKMALALPEARLEAQHGHAAFLVRKKTFGYFLNNHHGDGIVAVACKVLPGDNTILVKNDPARFYLPAYIGSRGWVALRLDTAEVDWEEVQELLSGSYVLAAPKKLADMVSASME